MRYNLVVATHHKTGTVWMDGVFKAIADDLGVQYAKLHSARRQVGDLDHGPFILFSYDSDFGDFASLLDREDVRILHLIRDPRDVVISAMHYHKASRESWLHESIPGYDNLSYQRALQSLPTKLAQYLFEMDNSSASTLRDMAGWHYGRANCFEARYEDLRQDTELVWQRILTFLGSMPRSGRSAADGSGRTAFSAASRGWATGTCDPVPSPSGGASSRRNSAAAFLTALSRRLAVAGLRNE